MKISPSNGVNIILATVLLFSMFFVGVTVSQPEYDPWLDTDDSGVIDMRDIGALARAFGTAGDSTKNVTVTNWPQSSDVLVWWDYSLVDGANENSGNYYSNGYSKLHLLIRIIGLSAAETVEFYFYGHLYNGAHSAFYPTAAYTHTFTSTDYYSAISIDVPSEVFHFRFDAATGTTCNVFLSYYLTWA